MRLNRLLTENYRQHRDLDLNLEGNLLGIVGDNGKGKSHLLDAIQFGLCGKVPGQNKSAMLTWGESEGSVTVYFEHANKPCRITRSVSGSGASLHIADEDVVKGQKNVNARMEEFTGIDYDVSRQAVFVRQAEIDSILFTQPAERQTAWQRLCGLGEVPKIHAKLGQVLNTYPEAQDLNARLDEAKETMDSMQEEKRELKKEKEELEAGLPDDDDVDIPDRLAKLERCQALHDQLVEHVNAVQKHTEARLALREDYVDLGAMQSYVNELAEYQEGLRMQVVTVLSNIETVKRVEDAKTACATAEREAKLAAEQLEVGNPQLESLLQMEAACRAKVTTLTKLCSIAGETCPTCQQPVGSEIKEAAAKEVIFADVELGELETTRKVAQQSKQVSETNLYRARGVLANNDQFRKAHCQPLVTYVAQQKELQAAAEQANAAYEKAKADLSAVTSANKQKVQLDTLRESALKSAEEAKQGIKAILAETGVESVTALPVVITGLRGVYESRRKIELRLAAVTGRLEQLQTSINSLFGTLDVLTKEMNDQKDYRKTMDTLQRVRDWFHYANGPKKVINSLLEEKCARTNDFLEKFGAPFAVEPDWEEVSFRYYYHDGRGVPEDLAPVKELSGGERVVLAVAFRFASYCMFAEQIGLLTLDEPTVYLDQNNIENFCTLLEKVRDVADKMDLQILISTHEVKLTPFFSGVTNLNE